MGRGRSWRGHGAGIVLAALLVAGNFGSSVARAEPRVTSPSEAFRMIWSSSAGCGDATRFLAELDGRTTRLRPARDGEHAITLIVELFGVAGGVRGQLTVRKPDGDLTVREVPGPNCEEVESALALIVALMVDPLAGNAEHVSVSTRDRPGTKPPANTAAPTPRAASGWSLRVEQRATLRSAVAPNLAWGQGLALMLTREGSGLHPSLGLSANLARSTTSQRLGSAEFEWAAAQLAVCPVGFQPAPGWDLRACGTFQAGRLRGVGFETVNSATKSIFWGALGLELQGRVKLVGPLWLGGEGALELPFSRERFYFEPGSTLHQVPALGASLGIGLGVYFF